ncbi:MAG: hypothetical protein CVU00_12165 [Bacteroidetes bacterium HGW-Bacteroidetes-17]|jgi:hypothetical protein|nr:MAG: hypothetical protein CVU00_12165 [Bacteroidetes bacterium HGW-Bacteroidetes-17]
MKTIIKIIALLLLTQTAVAQKKSIKAEQLFVTNKVTGKSFKIGSSVNTLKNFGTLIKADTLDLTVEADDYYIKHTFDNIIIFESVQGKISSYETGSNEIALERKGLFSISPGDHLDKIESLFPAEVREARIIEMTMEGKSFLLVNLQLSGFSSYENREIVSNNEGISLLFTPDTKILSRIKFWIRP